MRKILLVEDDFEIVKAEGKKDSDAWDAVRWSAAESGDCKGCCIETRNHSC